MKVSGYQGFTLVELLVALVIAGLLISAGIPRLADVFNDFSASSSADELVSTLAYARGQAIYRQEPVSVCSGTTSCSGSKTWTTGWIVFVDGNGDNNFSSTEPSDELLKVVEANNNNVAITHDTAIITFDRLGENTAAVATAFNVCSESANNNADKTIEISLVGYTSSSPGATCS